MHTTISTFLAAASTDSSGGGSILISLLPIAFLIGLFWLLLIRPQRKRMAAQRQMQSQMGIGDEVETIGGIQGMIRSVDPETETVVLEVEEGRIRVTRRAISASLSDSEPEEELDALSEGSDTPDADQR